MSSNLDEFFEVRFADALEAARMPGAGDALRELTVISVEAHALIDEQYAVFNEQVMPSLALHGIRVVNHAERTDGAARAGSTRFFEREVRPLLVPVGLDPAHPFPQVANKSLNFIAQLGGKQRVRAREHDRHRQGAARAAARDQAAGRTAARRASSTSCCCPA